MQMEMLNSKTLKHAFLVLILAALCNGWRGR